MKRLVLVAALLSLSACGSDPAAPVVENGLPPCNIQVGGSITEDLIENGCTEENGDIYGFVVAAFCGGPEITSYNDRFYGVVGGEWIAVVGDNMSADPAYIETTGC